MIVLDDVDPVKAAAAAVAACFSSMGQLCVSDERIYVQRAVAEPFIAAFVERTKALMQGFCARLHDGRRRADAAVPGRAGEGARRRRRRQGRDRASPAAASATISGRTSSSRPCSPGSPRRCPATRRRRSARSSSIAVVDTGGRGDRGGQRLGVRAQRIRVRRFGGPRRSGCRADRRRLCRTSTRATAHRSPVRDAPMGGMKQSGLGRRNGPGGFARFIESRTIARATGLLHPAAHGAEFAKLVPRCSCSCASCKGIRRR